MSRTGVQISRYIRNMDRMMLRPLGNHNTLFVDANATNASAEAGAGHTWNTACSTLDTAINNAAAGDFIYIADGHTENLTADSDVDVDKVGLTIIGLGQGARRPTFTCTVIAGDFKLAAASCSIENILFLNNVDQSTGLLEVSAADCSLKNIEIREQTGASYQATTLMALTGAARCSIDGLIMTGTTDAGTDSFIDITDSDDMELKNFRIWGEAATAMIDFIGTASTGVWIHDGYIWNDDASDPLVISDTITACTGCIGPNLVLFVNDDSSVVSAALVFATGFVAEPVVICNKVAEKTMAIDWTASLSST